MGRMKPLVMFLYQMVQLKVMPWNLMFFWQKSMVYLPLGTERLTSRRVASDSPANSPILALQTICLQIFSAALSFSFSSPQTSISPPSSLSSLGSSTWKRIQHMQSSFPTQSEAVQTMISFLLMVELLMALQLMVRIWWFPDMETRERLELSYPMRPQFMPLNDIKRQISIKYNDRMGLDYKVGGCIEMRAGVVYRNGREELGGREEKWGIN